MQEHGYILTVEFLSTKITINFWAVVLLASCLNAAVVVETRDEQVQNTSQTLLRLRAFNGTGDTLRPKCGIPVLFGGKAFARRS